MTIFITTMVFTVVLFIGAALLFNFSKQKAGRSRPSGAAGCHQNGIGCSCSSVVQTTISRL